MRRFALAALCLLTVVPLAAQEKKMTTTAYCRFQTGSTVAYGIVEGKTIRQLDGNLFASPKPTEKLFNLDEVKLLIPCEAKNVFAMAGNYQSHL